MEVSANDCSEKSAAIEISELNYGNQPKAAKSAQVRLRSGCGQSHLEIVVPLSTR